MVRFYTLLSLDLSTFFSGRVISQMCCDCDNISFAFRTDIHCSCCVPRVTMLTVTFCATWSSEMWRRSLPSAPASSIQGLFSASIAIATAFPLIYTARNLLRRVRHQRLACASRLMSVNQQAIQCESKKSPLRLSEFFHFFHKQLRICNQFFPIIRSYVR